jgi:hypothetical protein
MDGEIGCGNAFVNLDLSKDGEGGGRIDQRSNRATVNHTLILSQFVADSQVNGDRARAYLAQFETE